MDTVYTEYSYGGPKNYLSGSFKKFTDADVTKAGIGPLKVWDNGRIMTTLDNCKKACTAKSDCLYFMWSGKKGIDSYTRCYAYGKFGTYKDNFMNPYKTGSGDLGYTTYSNCNSLFKQYTKDILIS